MDPKGPWAQESVQLMSSSQDSCLKIQVGGRPMFRTIWSHRVGCPAGISCLLLQMVIMWTTLLCIPRLWLLLCILRLSAQEPALVGVPAHLRLPEIFWTLINKYVGMGCCLYAMRKENFNCGCFHNHDQIINMVYVLKGTVTRSWMQALQGQQYCHGLCSAIEGIS